MTAQLTETIDGSHALPEDKRAELRGVISTMPGLNRYLRVTPGGLLRVDAGKAKAEENLDGKYVFVPVGGFASGRFGEPRRRTAGNEDGAIRAEAPAQRPRAASARPRLPRCDRGPAGRCHGASADRRGRHFLAARDPEPPRAGPRAAMRAAILHKYGTPVCGEFAEPVLSPADTG